MQRISYVLCNYMFVPSNISLKIYLLYKLLRCSCQNKPLIRIGSRIGQMTRSEPLFHLASWNHYFDVISGGAMTNNSCEGNLLIISFGLLQMCTHCLVHTVQYLYYSVCIIVVSVFGVLVCSFRLSKYTYSSPLYRLQQHMDSKPASQ